MNTAGKKSGGKGFFITLGALMAVGAVSLAKKTKSLCKKCMDKMKS